MIIGEQGSIGALTLLSLEQQWQVERVSPNDGTSVVSNCVTGAEPGCAHSAQGEHCAGPALLIPAAEKHTPHMQLYHSGKGRKNVNFGSEPLHCHQYSILGLIR